MSSNDSFDVEIRKGSNWQKLDGSLYINKLSQATKLAQSTASKRQAATRVVNEKGKVMAEFEANGQRPNRRRRRSGQ